MLKRTLLSLGICAALTIGSASVAEAGPLPKDAPLQLSGAEWLGGHGIPICKSSTIQTCAGQPHVGGVASNWWQCVEAAQRLYNRAGWYSGLFPVSKAREIYDKGPAMGMTQQPNGAVGLITPGDMIVMPDNRAGRAGHVTMVDSVSKNGDGTNTIHTVGQNVPSSPFLDFKWHAGIIDSPWANYTVRGVVHSPKNSGTGVPGGGGGSYEHVETGGGVHITGPNSYTDVSSGGHVYAWNGGYYGGNPGGYSGWFSDAKVTSDGGGYWLLTTYGQVYAYGNAPYVGGSPARTSDIVAMAATPDSRGYVMMSLKGEVYAYGTPYRGGSPAGYSGEFVDIEMTPDGGGYWLLTSAGQIYAYGNAPYVGGSPVGFDRAIVAMSATKDGKGYVLVSKTGQVYAYGDAAYSGGSPGGVTGYISDVSYRTDGGQGYILVSSTGQHYAYNTPWLGNPDLQGYIF